MLALLGLGFFIWAESQDHTKIRKSAKLPTPAARSAERDPHFQEFDWVR